jgi:phosphate transport system substrate-binding protein
MLQKLLVAVLATVAVSTASARDYISIAGSSTVLPFATIVAERLGRQVNQKTPVVESGGSSVGKKGVCDGIGTQFIDIGNASSRMKVKELEYCEKNGVKLTEIKVGYDGIVLANSKNGTQLNISLADLGKALSKKNAEVKAIGYKAKQCRAMRTDGAYIEAGEQDNLIVQKLQDDPDSYGIFGFSYLDQNSDTLQGAVLSGVEPTFEAIADGSYKASRALYFYVKHNHIGVVPGLAEYMTEWTKHWGEDGALTDAGMIPMPSTERMEMAVRMEALPVLTADDLK